MTSENTQGGHAEREELPEQTQRVTHPIVLSKGKKTVKPRAPVERTLAC